MLSIKVKPCAKKIMNKNYLMLSHFNHNGNQAYNVM